MISSLVCDTWRFLFDTEFHGRADIDKNSMVLVHLTYIAFVSLHHFALASNPILVTVLVPC